MTPHNFLNHAKYQDVIEYKLFAAKCADFYGSRTGSTNALKRTLSATMEMKAKIQIYLK